MVDKSVFGFQWHITDRCNLRCTHCYQEDYSGAEELDLNGLKSIANEIIRTLAKWDNKASGYPMSDTKQANVTPKFSLCNY